MTKPATNVFLVGCVLTLSATPVSGEPEPKIEPLQEACGLPAALAARPVFLEDCRSSAVGPEYKRAVLASLPAEGNVTRFSRADEEKLEAMAEVLRLYGREEAYEVRVIDVPQAWMGLHERAVLLISKPELRLLSAENLQALVAHEAAHEYFWDEYQVAHEAQQAQRLHVLELACDSIGVQALQQLGIDPMQLAFAFEKVQLFNEQRFRFGMPIDLASHPSVKERKRLIRRLIADK